MATFLRERVTFSAQAIALRLRLETMMKRQSLPDLLGALTPINTNKDTNDLGAAPLTVVDQALADVESILERIPVVPDTCLYRSLARYAVLRSAGYPARFIMALGPNLEEVAGHAWVELDGEPYGEIVDPDLVVTYSYPSPARAEPRGMRSAP